MSSSYQKYKGRLSKIDKNIDIEEFLAYEEERFEGLKKELKIAQESIEVMSLKRKKLKNRFSLQKILNIN